jgi:hypothetical protein
MAGYLWSRGGAAPPAPDPPAPAPTFASGAAAGRPLELVRFDAATGAFVCGAEALAALRAAHGPVGVVAVAGRARQGKSYVLNQLLGRAGGFAVGPTHRPCTKGLWMWGAPVERAAADGSRCSLIFLDTEGIDAYDQTAQYSTQVFSLAVLLSSLFMYNQMGGIDEAALERLSLVSEMTRRVRVRAGGSGTCASGASNAAATDAAELAEFAPSFLWLLRDFYLRLEEDGRTITPRDYLEAALAPLPLGGGGGAAAAAAKNAVRASIKALFGDRDCVALVRPAADEAALASLDTAPASALRPEFKAGVAELARLVFAKAQPKRLGAQVLTGPALAGLCEAYVAAINAGAVPTIATAWQGVAEAECRRAADAAEAAAAAAFAAAAPPPDEGALGAAVAAALAAGAAAFAAGALGEGEVRAAADARWRAAAAARFAAHREAALARAALGCERAAAAAAARLVAAARRPGAAPAELAAELAAAERVYLADPAAAGPDRLPRLADVVRGAYAGALADLAARREAAGAAAAAQAAATAQAARAAGEAAAARAAAAEGSASQAAARVAALERDLAAARAELAALRGALEAARAETAAARAAAGQAGAAAAGELDALRRQAAGGAADAAGWAARVAALEGERDAIRAAAAAAAAARDDAVAARAAADVERGRAERRAADAERAAAAAAASQGAAIDEDAMVAGGFAAAGEDAAAAGPAPAAAAAGPALASMTVNAIKAWLMEGAGAEAAVWELAKRKPKRADWEALARAHGAA